MRVESPDDFFARVEARLEPEGRRFGKLGPCARGHDRDDPRSVFFDHRGAIRCRACVLETIARQKAKRA